MTYSIIFQMQMLYTIFLTTILSTASAIVYATFTVSKQHACCRIGPNLVLKLNVCRESSFRYHNAFKATRFLSRLFPSNVTGQDSCFNNKKYKLSCPPTLICFMRMLKSLKMYALPILSRSLLEECISPIFVPSVSIFI